MLLFSLLTLLINAEYSDNSLLILTNAVNDVNIKRTLM